jgi:hypothetical protein
MTIFGMIAPVIASQTGGWAVISNVLILPFSAGGIGVNPMGEL